MADEELVEEQTEQEPVAEEAEPERLLPEQPLLAAIVEPHESATWVAADDEWVVIVSADEYHSLAQAAKNNGFDTFIDLCGVDYYRARPRFEVVLTVLNYSEPMRLRIRSGAIGDEPKLDSVTDVYTGANFYEREAYDMFGIEFVGHPDLTRILMPDDWEGYPLRKDYAVGSVPIQFKDAPKVQ
ncbi:MAG: NADH-quinone oxidoreductase subunit C [Acidimicrobiia bacterium]|nr:NADH-quinone oxidoreductase subunit C [Acidimicrobiia bacterium]